MMLLKRNYDNKKELYSVDVSVYNFHYNHIGKNKKYASMLYNSFEQINLCLKKGYNDMIQKYPNEFPTYERFMELLDNSCKEVCKDE